MVRRLIGSNTTNSSGVATINYTGTGSGKVRIIAESGNLVSEPYTFYDVKFKDIGTDTDYSNWNTSSTMDIIRSATETTLQPLDPTAFSSRYVATGTATTIEFDYNMNIDAVGFSLRQGTVSSTSFSAQYLGTVGQTDMWHNIKIETNGTKYRAIIDGNEKEWKDMTGSQTFNRFYVGINADSGLVIKYKNFLMY